jgi:hypothetical protein
MADWTDADFNRWLKKAAELHRQAFGSGLHPDRLGWMGGVFALAGDDIARTDLPWYVGLFPPSHPTRARAILQAQAAAWASHERAIRERRRKLGSPSRAVEQYILEKTHTWPQPIAVLEDAAREAATASGQHMPNWTVAVHEYEAKLRHLPSITQTSLAVVRHARHPRESWQESFEVAAEAEALIAPVTTALSEAKRQHIAVHPASRAPILSPATTHPNRSTTSGRPSPQQRATGRRTGVGAESVPVKPPPVVKPPPKPAVSPAKPAPPATAQKPSTKKPPKTPDEPKPHLRPVAPAAARALPKLKELKVDVDHDYTRQKLTEIYNRYPTPLRLIDSEGVLRIEEQGGGRLMHGRAGIAELRVLVRKGKEPGVKSIRFVPPSNQKGEHRPDLEVTYHNGKVEFIEVKAITGVPADAKVFDHKARARPANPTTIARFVERLADTMHKGQITKARPGTLAIHAFKEKASQTALEGWRDVLGQIRRTRGFPEGLNRIQITTPGGELVFEGPGWEGRIVRE